MHRREMHRRRLRYTICGYRRFRRQPAARRSDPWIHDHEKNGSRREIPIARRQLEVRRQDIMWRNIVRDVHERYVWTDAEHDRLHRAGVVIERAEVAQESDDRSSHASILLSGGS